MLNRYVLIFKSDLSTGNDKVMISVLMITYNHEQYIQQAIEGVLMQQCDFPYEVVIGEDFSTDSTREICEQFAKQYANILRLLPTERNLGMMPNFIRTWQACTGNYIALCEGDDYWTDPYKLQKQVDFLESNPTFIFVFHDAYFLNQKTNERRLRIDTKKIDNVVDLKSVILEKNITTASLVYRNILDNKSIPDWFIKIMNGDYGLCVLLAEKGPGWYFPDAMSVYRVHDGGVWNNIGADNNHKTNEYFYNQLLQYFTDREVRKIIRRKLRWTHCNYGITKIKQGKLFSGGYFIICNLQLCGDRRVRTNLREVLYAIKAGVKSLFVAA